MSILGESSHLVRFADFEIDLRSGDLRKGNQRILLSDKPLQLLSVLLERPGALVTRDEIIQRLWPNGTFVDFTVALNKTVNRLREALHDSADQPRLIETVPKRGYRFVAPVDVGMPRPESGIATPPSILPAPDLLVRPLNRTASGRFWKTALALIATVCGVIGAATVYDTRRHSSVTHRPNLQNLHFIKLTESGKVEDASISPDGRYLAYLYGDGRGLDQIQGWMGDKSSLRLRQVATRSEVQILVNDADLYPGLTFSPDGNYIYFLRNADRDDGVRDLIQIPTLGGTERKVLHDIDTAVAFSPDGRQFVYLRGLPREQSIEVRIAGADGSSDHPLTTLSGEGLAIGCGWSPDGQSIAVTWVRVGGGTTNFRLDVIPVDHPRAVPLFSSPNAIGRPRWLPDGSGLIFILEDSNRRGQFWTIPYPTGETRQLTNDPTDYDLSIDATPDAHSLLAMEVTLVSNLELAPSSLPSKSREIAAGEPIFNALPLDDRRIVTVRGGDRELWIMNGDGSNPRALGIHEVVWPARCGPYLIFMSRSAVMRINRDGTDVKTLATGHSPVCSPDAHFVYYVELTKPRWKIRRVPINGGAPVNIVDNPGETTPGLLSISPDGKWLAFPFDRYTPTPVVQIAVVSATGGPSIHILRPPGVVDVGPRWSPDGKSLQYSLDRDGASNLWEQPIDGRPAHPITHFASDKIFDFAWSVDGRQLYLCRGHASADAVLIQNP